jgi:hypothetical protein
VVFTGANGGTVSLDTPYYVINSTGDSLQVAASLNGTALDLGPTDFTANLAEDVNRITAFAHGLLNGDSIRFTDKQGGTGLALDYTYYVRGATVDSFELAASLGGPRVDFGFDLLPGSTIVRRTEWFSGTSLSVRGDASTNEVISTGGPHGLVNGDVVVFSSKTGGSGVELFTKYFVVQSSGTDRFKLSRTAGGAVVPLGSAVLAPSVLVKQPPPAVQSSLCSGTNPFGAVGAFAPPGTFTLEDGTTYSGPVYFGINNEPIFAVSAYTSAQAAVRAEFGDLLGQPRPAHGPRPCAVVVQPLPVVLESDDKSAAERSERTGRHRGELPITADRPDVGL